MLAHFTELDICWKACLEEKRLAEDSQISLLHAGQHECIHIMCMELLNNIFVTCIALSKARYLLLERLASYGTKLSD